MGHCHEPSENSPREVRDGGDRCDLLYFLHRASVERVRATVCSDVRATAIHLEMAEEYDRRARAIAVQERSAGGSENPLRVCHADEGYRHVVSVAPTPAFAGEATETLEAVTAQLRQTSTHVGQIALAAGFNDLSNFNRVFRAIMGCSPTEFRRRSRPL